MDNNYRPIRNDEMGNPIGNHLEKEMAFAFRDKYMTETCLYPSIAGRLGENIDKRLNHNVSLDKYTARYVMHSVPGICRFKFEPVIALADDGDGEPATHQLFRNLYNDLKVFYNGTDKFQPCDLHIVSTAISLLRAYIATVEKAFDAAFVVRSSMNNYTCAKALLAGSPVIADLTTVDLDRLIRRWNTEVIGALNGVWLWEDFYAGASRWASLIEDYYVDDDTVGNSYAQLYTMDLNSYYTLEELPTKGWIFQRHAINGQMGLEDWINMVANFVEFMLEDQSWQEIQLCMKTVKQRGGEKSPVEVHENLFNYYPTVGRNINIRYDLRKLLAWHNATIAQWLIPSDVQPDPANGWLIQTFHLQGAPNANYRDRAIYSYIATNKILNFGCVTPSKAEMINATQWALSREKSYKEPDFDMPYELLGTDYICEADIVRYEWEQGQKRIRVRKVYGVMPDLAHNNDALLTDAEWLKIYYQLTHENQELRALASQFRFFPIIYNAYIFMHENNILTGIDRIDISGVQAELEVPYAVSYQSLADLKLQFARNYYNSPLNVPETGTFDYNDGEKVMWAHGVAGGAKVDESESNTATPNENQDTPTPDNETDNVKEANSGNSRNRNRNRNNSGKQEGKK